MAAAQYLLIRHGVLPSRYYSRPAGERLLIRALILDYLEKREEE